MNSSNFKIEGNFMLSNQEKIKNPEFFDLNSEKGMPKSVEKDSVSNVLNSKFSWAGVYSSVTGEEKSNSRQSSSAVESNCQDSSLIDLKLGRFPDKQDSQLKDNPSFTSTQSSVPRKRAKSGNLNSQTPFCQVEGCNRDLSACKDYNKRHKVCEIHSKTAKVHVNGSEQRFCQQCSRFHSLSEFDDGKRSCRKRLAGHNERRRKNHVSSSRRLIPPYNGTNFLGSSLAASSFVCPNVLHSSHLHPQKQEINNWNRNQTDYDTTTPHGIRNTNTSNESSRFHDNELIPMPRTKENEHYNNNNNNNSFMTNMSSSDFDSLSLYRNTPVVGGGGGGDGNEDLNVLDDSSSFRGLRQPSSSSSCALSLLSSQSQTQNSYISSNIPTSHYSIVQISGNPTPTSVDESNMDSLLITDNLGSDKYGYNEFLPGSSCGDDSTIDLLELSSQLHHVENERQSMQLKQENDPFFGLRIT